MGKLALWIFVAVAVMLLVRLFGPGKRRVGGDPGARGGSGPTGRKPGEAGDPPAQGNPGELMMSCAVCGVHVPASDAVFARGKVYCGTEHRDQGRGSKGPA